MRIQSAISGSERVFSFRLTRYELYEPSLVNICALPQTACRFLALFPLGASPMLLQARLDASCPSLLTVAGQQGLSAYRGKLPEFISRKVSKFRCCCRSRRREREG